MTTTPQNHQQTGNFYCTETVAAHRRVKWASATNPNSIALAGRGEEGHGVSVYGGSSGELIAVRERTMTGTVTMMASGAISVGAKVYPDSSGKVSATRYGKAIGIWLGPAAATADGDLGEVLPIDGSEVIFRYVQTEDSSENANSTTADVKSNKKATIPAGLLQVGDVIEWDATGKVIDNNSTDTLAAKMIIGASGALQSIAGVDVADNDVVRLRGKATVRAITASGAVFAGGEGSIGVPGTATMKATRSGSVSIDATAALDVAPASTWSVAHADNRFLWETFLVNVIRAG